MMALPFIGLAHFAVGALAVAAGAVALTVRKGSRGHRKSGHVFYFCMLALCASGIYMSVERAILFTMFLAILALYLVATGWMAVRRPPGTSGRFEKAACAAILSCGVAAVAVGTAALAGVPHLTNEVPAGTYLFWAGLALWFGALDYRVIRRGGITGQRRIARHLWRMCMAAFIASTIFFLGNNNVLPAFLRQPAFLYAPIILIPALMLFWQGRLLFSKTGGWPEKG